MAKGTTRGASGGKGERSAHGKKAKPSKKTAQTPERTSASRATEVAQPVPAATLPSSGLVDPAWAALIARFAPAIASRVAEFGPKVAAMAETILPLVPMDLLSTRVSATLPSVLEELRRLPVTVDAALDPRLQLAVINRLTGKKGLALTSTSGDEVAVIARVSSVEDWIDLEDVVPGANLGQANDKSWIVTGRLAIDRVERVRKSKAILSLKASQPLRPVLSHTSPAMQLLPADLPVGSNPEGGAGVIVGIVDFGCDFAHGNFRNTDGSTRVSAIWNQGAVAQVGSPFGYGRLFEKTSIDAALSKADPYTSLGYGPRPDGPGQSGSHGTHVMDIAAGNGGGSGQPGVAPAAEIIFVEADSTDIAWDGPNVVNQSFGDSVQLLEAVHFIFERAGDRPCVVNLSLGTNGGPHDGSSLVEQGLDALINARPNRAVVIAASNSQEDGIHTSGKVSGGAPLDVVMQQQNAGGGELEFWYPGNRRLEVTLIASDGTQFGPVTPGNTLPIGAGNQISIFISNRLDDPNNHDNVIAIWIAQGLSDGDWIVQLRSVDAEDVEFHGWIERDDRTQASFAVSVPTHTLGSISTGRSSIVVGSYDAHKEKFPLSSFSSSGPTRDGRQKPEVSAPGHAVMAARSRTVTGVVRKSGTSMAAPAVTGLVALVYAQAAQSGSSIPIDGLRSRLMDTTVPGEAGNNGWHPRYGFGRAIGQAISPEADV
ncbi:peptidase S8/S53 subtilisin kexin sedolisin [Sinorhizobium fredii]|uniref:Peptidase S8/S53 subtilisin kexin sedolisin n=1 Tax=Rhizobium fredii TaxID=380 RepID=A0A2A6LQU5_RHIFR|nr:S8 family serine peptidase [Sinorhizobium fredii]PDT44745.1 peptidase S8/S53 subtilisin kexin sedolisin [Sinorhizobium fredii]